jgi:hypothetical protein
MDLSKALKSGYYQALYPEIGVPIYDAFAIPENAAYPYVIISSITTNEIQNTTCKKFNAEVTVDIVTGFTRPTGMDQAFDIAEDIDAIINPMDMDDININAYGWEIGETRLTSSNNVQLRTGEYWIYRNIRTYFHIVVPFD